MSNSRIEQLKKFLEQNRNDSFVLYALATEYVNLGDDDTGLQYFRKVLDHDPGYTGVYYHLGKLYQRANEVRLAEETFREGIKRTTDKDPLASRELRQALDELLFEED